MRIYVKNIRANFHPDPIGNDGAWRRSPQQQVNNKMSGDMRSVPELK